MFKVIKDLSILESYGFLKNDFNGSYKKEVENGHYFVNSVTKEIKVIFHAEEKFWFIVNSTLILFYTLIIDGVVKYENN